MTEILLNPIESEMVWLGIGMVRNSTFMQLLASIFCYTENKKLNYCIFIKMHIVVCDQHTSPESICLA